MPVAPLPLQATVSAYGIACIVGTSAPVCCVKLCEPDHKCLVSVTMIGLAFNFRHTNGDACTLPLLNVQREGNHSTCSDKLLGVTVRIESCLYVVAVLLALVSYACANSRKLNALSDY